MYAPAQSEAPEYKRNLGTQPWQQFEGFKGSIICPMLLTTESISTDQLAVVLRKGKACGQHLECETL
jgi:hypothetical protein